MRMRANCSSQQRTSACSNSWLRTAVTCPASLNGATTVGACAKKVQLLVIKSNQGVVSVTRTPSRKSLENPVAAWCCA